MLSSIRLKEIVSEARLYIERQMDDAEIISGFRDVVAAEGGDWSALKALIKAQIKDERDETGNGGNVQKILDKAEFSAGYADMLGWSNMNEQNFSADDEDHDRSTGEITHSRPSPKDEIATASELPPGEEAVADIQPEAANDLPAQEGGGNETCSESDLLGKSNAARPASVDAQPNGRGSAGEAGDSVVTAGRGPQPNSEPHLSAGVQANDSPIVNLAMTRAEKVKALRPLCQSPEACRSSGEKNHCGSCLRAASERDGAA